MAFNSAVVLSALTAYIDQLTNSAIIHESVLEGRTIKMIQRQTGLKTKRALNMMTSDPVLTNQYCGLPIGTGSATLTQNLLEPCYIQMTETICQNGTGTLETFWTGMLMKKGQYYNDLEPAEFAKAYVDDKILKIQDIVEKLLWLGNTNSGTAFVTSGKYQANMLFCNGFLEKFLYEAGSASVITGTFGAAGALSTTTGYQVIDNMYNSMLNDQEAVNIAGNEDLVTFVSYNNFAAYVQSLRTINNFFINAADIQNWEYRHPSAINLKVVATSGLLNTNYIILTSLSNLFIGFDSETDTSAFEIFYDRLTNSIIFRCMWVQAVQAAYYQYVLLKTS